MLTVDEYGNKHQPEVAIKMANLWEKKIGSDVSHNRKPGHDRKKTSPTTVVNSSGAEVGGGITLSKAGDLRASSKPKKTKTKEVVKSGLDSSAFKKCHEFLFQ